MYLCSVQMHLYEIYRGGGGGDCDLVVACQIAEECAGEFRFYYW